MGITMTIEIFDEEDVVFMIAAMNRIGGALLDYVEEEDA